MNPHYQRTQNAAGLTAALLTAGLVLVAIVVLVPNDPDAAIGGVIAAVVVVILMAAAAVFHRMTITVDRERLHWCFGFGVLHREVALAEIEGVERTRSHPIEGWGIHWTRRGWLYDVSGLDAVLVRLRGGKTFLLGTPEPDRLVAAIEAAR